jgi:hypothetical protein
MNFWKIPTTGISGKDTVKLTSVSSDGGYVYIGREDGKVVVRDSKNLSKIRSFATGAPVKKVIARQRGRVYVLTEASFDLYSGNGEIILSDIPKPSDGFVPVDAVVRFKESDSRLKHDIPYVVYSNDPYGLGFVTGTGFVVKYSNSQFDVPNFSSIATYDTAVYIGKNDGTIELWDTTVNPVLVKSITATAGSSIDSLSANEEFLVATVSEQVVVFDSYSLEEYTRIDTDTDAKLFENSMIMYSGTTVQWARMVSVLAGDYLNTQVSVNDHE